MHLWLLDDPYQFDYIDWLFGLIRASSSPNKTLETFIIRVAYPNETVELLREKWEFVFRSLFDNIFPSLKTLTILITADEGRNATSWYDWFNRSKYVKKLRSKRGINVEVLVKAHLGKVFAVGPLSLFEIPDEAN